MTESATTKLVGYVKKGEIEKFRSEIENYVKCENIMDFIKECSSNEIKLAANWSIKSNVYLFHKVFEKIEDVKEIDILKHTYFEKLDQEKRTCLHIAVIFNRNIEILKYLILKRSISIDSEDEYAYTPLHYYCQREKYDENVLGLLLTNQNQLTKQSKDGLTPLEFVCSNKDNLELICKMKLVKMKVLLRNIDKVSTGVIDVQYDEHVKNLSIDRIWLHHLQKNDRYLLLSYIRNEVNFVDKYYLTPDDMLAIIRKCPENGQGILLFVKENYVYNKTDVQLDEIFYGLTGIKIKEKGKERLFYKSSLFLAVLTGRFQLVSPLLRSCQLEIVSYAILICLICKKLALEKTFPDLVVKDILELKDFCEEYAIEVLYRTYNKDLGKSKDIINKYISRPMKQFDGKSILEIADYGKCHKFLSLPMCQECLTKMWRQCGTNCPLVKFCLHSLTHIAFLIVLSIVVVNEMYGKIDVLEILCYVYGLGYLAEEVREIYFALKEHHIHQYFRDVKNMIDISAIVLIVVAFLIRVSCHGTVSSKSGELGLFEESRYDHIFALRLFLCLSLILFYMRLLYFASIFEILGPKLTMISTMIVKDLIPLILIFNVFMVSFGVVFQALLFPNRFYVKDDINGTNVMFGKKDLKSTVGNIFKRATFTIFDFHHTLNDIENYQSDYKTDDKGRYAVYILLIVFMVVVNVMLMNLLIALLSYTVTRIIAESKQSWKSSRYAFIQEYINRSVAPPPINLVTIPFELLVTKMKNNKKNKNNKKSNRSRINDEVGMELFARGHDAAHNAGHDADHDADPDLMSYYICQAFAMTGQRYRLHKDVQDLEYEKEAHFRMIEEKLRVDKEDINKLINDLQASSKRQEEKLRVDKEDIKKLIKDLQASSKRHKNISSTCNLK